MKAMNKLLIAMTAAAIAGGAVAKNKPEDANNLTWKEKYPEQYNSWATTKDDDELTDALAEDPNLVILWAGYGFSKDYNKPRGHYYALIDNIRTLRTGGPMTDTDGPMAASCWGCKTPDLMRMYDKVGEGEFSSKKWGAWGDEMGNVIGCADCHDAETGKAMPQRPFAMRAFAASGQKFEDQEENIQSAMACGQCHVEYYFDGTDSKKVKFPWNGGMGADEILAYYDALGFKDWTHKVSKAPMLKAQHPEWETWSSSMHAEMDVTCIDCHMPKVENASGKEFTKHNVGNAIDNFDATCSGCHDTKQELVDALAAQKHEVETAKLAAEDELVKAHFEAGEAWKAGATEAEMKAALQDIRHAQWRWDYSIASHGIHAHNPELAVETLGTAKENAIEARAKLKKVLAKHGVTKVTYPDYSTKAAAQAAIGLDKAKLDAEKKKFLEERVQKEWPVKVEF
ncbi:ammonia-forming cytochrome c nitrite reductase [Ferrimonas aestuarii]|uniref:nitrite reductase (cytochrome; ammonia-forming) n=1 Tax=Ferrimonas aestuarii TaxID=2569539 RepID=A0A4U1BK27_9GAMM|nr:ammonia-forming cytochrome c nitrite reductase [Ferrimonas aestuarii]TKB51956.1 ammonia-forming cytochrome c nitrite reductase [Ferrimonas aestuarii]